MERGDKARIGVGFDADGRAGSETGTCSAGSTVTAVTRTYDAENHTTGEVCNGIGGDTATYAWGPTGRLAQMVSNGATYSLHWDGNTLLYVTDSGGTVVQENVEKLATWTSATNTLTVRDRDYAGAVATQHQATEDDAWLPGGQLYRRVGMFAGMPAAQYPGGTITGNADTTNAQDAITRFMVAGEVLGMNHVDGYDDVNLTFQGARASDPVTGQWTTPDAYAGNVHDPMSQRSYMLNGNNAVSYADPTGYSVVESWGAGPKPDSDSLGGSGGFQDITADFTQTKGTVTLATPVSPSQVGAGAVPSNGDASDIANGVVQAFVAGVKYERVTLAVKFEFGGLIYRTGDNQYGFTVVQGSTRCGPNVQCNVDVEAISIPTGATLIGTWHTHPPGPENGDFSGNDRIADQVQDRINGFLITASGALKVELYMGYRYYPTSAYQPVTEITLCTSCIPH